jgi:hypothetical protein
MTGGGGNVAAAPVTITWLTVTEVDTAGNNYFSHFIAAGLKAKFH